MIHDLEYRPPLLIRRKTVRPRVALLGVWLDVPYGAVMNETRERRHVAQERELSRLLHAHSPCVRVSGTLRPKWRVDTMLSGRYSTRFDDQKRSPSRRSGRCSHLAKIIKALPRTVATNDTIPSRGEPLRLDTGSHVSRKRAAGAHRPALRGRGHQQANAAHTD